MEVPPEIDKLIHESMGRDFRRVEAMTKERTTMEASACNMALRSAVFEVLRRHDVGEQCFAEVAAITHAALTTAQTEAAAKAARIAELEEAIKDALKCTPSIRITGVKHGNFQREIIYDCGDPWAILRAALSDTQP